MAAIQRARELQKNLPRYLTLLSHQSNLKHSLANHLIMGDNELYGINRI